MRADTQGYPIMISEDPDRPLNSIQVFRVDVKNTIVWWKRLGRHPFWQAMHEGKTNKIRIETDPDLERGLASTQRLYYGAS